MGVRNLLDGALSVVSAVTTAGLIGIPIWFTHLAAQAGLAPQWVYGVLAVLSFVAISIVLAFLGKAARGVGPLRDRRRS